MGTGSVELLVITALCIAVIFAFVVLLARWAANGIRNAVSDALHKSDSGSRTGLEILDEGYARDEIGHDECQRIRPDIERA